MILFLDDEPDRTKLYVEELKQRRLPVVYFDNVVDAWEFLQRSGQKVDIAVLDVMMTSGPPLSATETEGGLRSGIAFYRHLRRISPDCHVLFLTNVTNPSARASIGADAHVQWFVKTDTFFDEFADAVAILFKASGATPDGKERSDG